VLRTETNPFARKAGAENTRNPFARKTESNKTIQKSESFFEKIDAVDEGGAIKSKRSAFCFGLPCTNPITYYLGPLNKSNGKERDKTSTGSRQTTLLGMLPAQPKDKNKQKNPFGKKKAGIDSIPVGPQVEVGTTQNSDSQTTDVMMSDGLTVVETSHDRDQYDTVLEETQLVEDDDCTQVCVI
jgi:chromosome transmission fidelity protein 4